MYDNTSRVIDVDIDEILPNRFQPRIQFDEEEILELSDSIKEHGVIQPIVVRSIGDKYEIIAGERRYKASVLAGKETVPVIVKNLNDKDSAEIALIENVQRKNLTPIEEALSYKKILDMGYLTQETLASKLGKSQPSVANKIRLLNLSDEVQEALLENKISERHARSLLKLQTNKEQNEMLNRIITERLTVRRTDEEIEKLKNSDEGNENSDSQKEMERGEINMNNNIFGIPSVPQEPQQSTPSFDIFNTGVQNEQQVPSQAIVQPQSQDTGIYNAGVQVPVQQQPIIQQATVEPSVQPQSQNFDIFGGSNQEQSFFGTPTPVSNVETPAVQEPEIKPIMPQTQQVEEKPALSPSPIMGGIQFDAEGNVVAAPSVDNITAPVRPQPQVTPEVPSMPVMESIPEIQPISISQLPESEPTIPESVNNEPTNETPIQPITQQPTFEQSVPQTSPIIESTQVEEQPQMTTQSEDLFSFGNDSNTNPVEQQSPSVPEFKMPEPIIVTDYSKQYDPIMPQVDQPVIPKVEFREVINAIRECSNKIEQYGYKIDVEEYDLANLYQVIFKIEK